MGEMMKSILKAVGPEQPSGAKAPSQRAEHDDKCSLCPPQLEDDTFRRTTLELEEGLSAPSTFVALGLCQLNQWALDFDGNLNRIVESIKQVKALGGYYRLGPELEVSGYSCDDHFHETDTTAHCWQSLVKILRSDLSHNCLLDIGMPVEHNSVRYNSRIYILNGQIVLVRPKLFLANDGGYRETRHFGAWKLHADLEEFQLPKSVQRLYGQKTCPIGFAGVQCNDCIIAAESCEELFTPESPHLQMCLGGVDIFCNGSASYFEIGKLQRRLDLIMAPTQKMGGIYMYCNCKGNDGGNSFFDGASFITCNGELVNMVAPFSCNDVEVIVEHVNLSRVRSFRACNPSYAIQASGKVMHTVSANIWLSGVDDSSVRVLKMRANDRAPLVLPTLPEQLGRGAACWLWDYLRRSGAQGFFCALSGGADSAAVSAIVRIMCESVFQAVEAGVTEVIPDLERILRMDRFHIAFPKSGKELCFQLLHTAYLGTSVSSDVTKERAARIAEQINSYHVVLNIDDVVESQLQAAGRALGGLPRFAGGPDGGSFAEDVARQNLQARSRTVVSYLLSGLLPTARAIDRLARPKAQQEVPVSNFATLSEAEQTMVGNLLALSTGNIDEVLRGYFTKYDCSSGDLAPIGAMSKINLKRFLQWAADLLEAPALVEALLATPTAELRPARRGSGGLDVAQTDEEDMGLTYNELYYFGSLRKNERCGPVEMYERLVELWKSQGCTKKDVTGLTSPSRLRTELSTEIVGTEALNSILCQPNLTPHILANKVKHFFRTYASNRHKTVVLPPSYHAESYDPDASRFDWRPFLYPNWDRQFRQIDQLLKLAEKSTDAPATMPGVPARIHSFLHGPSVSSK